jgi:hypothetical protein
VLRQPVEFTLTAVIAVMSQLTQFSVDQSEDRNLKGINNEIIS